MIKSFLLALGMHMQPDTVLQVTLMDSIQQKSDFITTDVLSNIYLINGASVTKYSSTGDSLYTTNFNAIRGVEYFDASQALKMYAVNFSFNALMVLDNTLTTQNSPISFNKIPVEQVSLFCASNFNNTVWIFDGINMQLIKTDQNFRVINSSINFYSNQQLTGIPNYMTESDNLLYINIPENGIKVFNQNCNFIQSIPLKIEKKFLVRNSKIYYLEHGKLHYYNLKEFYAGEVPVAIENIEDFSIEKNHLMIKKKNSVYLFDARF
jgi:hypothetical protein